MFLNVEWKYKINKLLTKFWYLKFFKFVDTNNKYINLLKANIIEQVLSELLLMHKLFVLELLMQVFKSIKLLSSILSALKNYKVC